MNKQQKVLLSAAGIGAGLLLRSAFRSSTAQELKGQVVLITGGSKGLGLALAREFGAQGCRLVLCARQAEELGAARRELEGKGVPVLAVICDVTDEAAVKQMVKTAQQHYGRIDILVNNAGQIGVGPVTSMTVQDFDAAMKVIFWGTVYSTLAVLPSFLERKSGHIVNITSIGGKVSIPHLVPYTCAKFAATGFSEGIHAELQNEGIHVLTVAPGLMRTGSYVNALFKGKQEEEAKWFSLGASTPLMTISADSAAQKIVKAVKQGDAELVLSGPAKALTTLHGVAPGLSTELLGTVAGLLLPGKTGKTAAKTGGALGVLRSPWMRLLLTLGRSAAARYGQRQTA